MIRKESLALIRPGQEASQLLVKEIRDTYLGSRQQGWHRDGLWMVIIDNRVITPEFTHTTSGVNSGHYFVMIYSSPSLCDTPFLPIRCPSVISPAFL